MSSSRVLYDKSKFQDVLCFPESPPGKSSYFELPFGSYSLEGRILYNEAGDDPWVLSIHGAKGDYTKANAISFALQERGYSLLGMNMSGHSKAGILSPEETSLATNIQEVEAFFDALSLQRKKVVIGYSLGGTPALKLLQGHAADIDKLILFYPGLYDKEAYSAHYGKEFRAMISEPYSYRRTDVLDALRDFKGDLLLIKGQYDGLDPVVYGKAAGGSAGEVEVEGRKYYSPIPQEVFTLLQEAVPEERRQFIEVPACDHSIIVWLRQHPMIAQKIVDRIDAFIKK